jgi:hypothetical protein
MLSTVPTPDALYVPSHYKQGATQRERLAAIDKIAYPMLEVDKSKGEMAFIRMQNDGGDEWMFITKNLRDSLLFPKRHPRHPEPRYDWVEDPGTGIRRGYLRQ